MRGLAVHRIPILVGVPLASFRSHEGYEPPPTSSRLSPGPGRKCALRPPLVPRMRDPSATRRSSCLSAPG